MAKYSVAELNRRRFTRLQQRLQPLFDGKSAADNTTAIIIPSLTLDIRELKKVPAAAHYEERLLFLLQLLAKPRTHVIYVTSEPMDQEVINYALRLVTSTSYENMRQRLTLFDCQDGAQKPLVQKILQRPYLIKQILRDVADPLRAYLVTFTSSCYEQELALKMNMPLYACDPELLSIGTKSGSRKLFKQVGIPISEGTEDIWEIDKLAAGLASLKTANPRLDKAIIKLNESFAGGGNAIFSFAGAPSNRIKAWAKTELPIRLQFGSAEETWASYLEKLSKTGGIVEAFVDSPGTRSLSAQLEITPDGVVHILSTHEQMMGGALGQTFSGCSFPAPTTLRLKLQDLGLLAGRSLAEQGVHGHLNIDFVSRNTTHNQLVALEINLRMGGATTPFAILHGLVGGAYDQSTGHYKAPDGVPRYYVSTDKAADDSFRGLSPKYAIEIAMRKGLHYNRATRTGAAFFVLSGLSAGRIGLVAIETSPKKALSLYNRTLAALKQM